MFIPAQKNAPFYEMKQTGVVRQNLYKYNLS